VPGGPAAAIQRRRRPGARLVRPLEPVKAPPAAWPAALTAAAAALGGGGGDDDDDDDGKRGKPARRVTAPEPSPRRPAMVSMAAFTVAWPGSLGGVGADEALGGVEEVERRLAWSGGGGRVG
jgi:hypothetical protein